MEEFEKGMKVFMSNIKTDVRMGTILAEQKSLFSTKYLILDEGRKELKWWPKRKLQPAMIPKK